MLNSFDIIDVLCINRSLIPLKCNLKIPWIIIKSFWCNSFWTLLHTQKNIFVNFVHNCGIKKLVFSLMHIFFLSIVCRRKSSSNLLDATGVFKEKLNAPYVYFFCDILTPFIKWCCSCDIKSTFIAKLCYMHIWLHMISPT